MSELKHGDCWPWYFETIDPKEQNKEPILGYRKGKQAKHITIGGKGKVASLKKKGKK